MKAFITKVTPWFPMKVVLQWDLDEVNESGVFLFDVERSGSPGGPWTVIATALADTYTYDDDLDAEDANVLSLARDIYYRIGVTPPRGAPYKFYSPAINLDGQAATDVIGPNPVMGFQVLDPAQFEVDPRTGQTVRPQMEAQPHRLRLLRRKILRDEYIRLRRLVGVEFYLLKRRHFGTRCTTCYDPTTREVTRSRCPVCYGTSWSGGYFTPVAVYGAQQTSQIQSNLSPQTTDDIRLTRVQFLDFPRIDEGDLLVEKAHNRRFLVKQRYYTTLKNVTVHQTITASELERQAIEYSVTVSL